MAGDDVPEVGDKASWNWNGAQPGGEVVEKKSEGEVAIQSKRGNTIKKAAQPDDPAIHLARSGNDVVKNQSELQVDEKTSKDKEDEEPAAETNGTKRKAEDAPAEENGAKKTKGKGKGGAAKKSGEAADSEKKRGRPKGQGAGKKEKKPPAPPTGIGKRTRSQK